MPDSSCIRFQKLELHKRFCGPGDVPLMQRAGVALEDVDVRFCAVADRWHFNASDQRTGGWVMGLDLLVRRGRSVRNSDRRSPHPAAIYRTMIERNK